MGQIAQPNDRELDLHIANTRRVAHVTHRMIDAPVSTKSHDWSSSIGRYTCPCVCVGTQQYKEREREIDGDKVERLQMPIQVHDKHGNKRSCSQLAHFARNYVHTHNPKLPALTFYNYPKMYRRAGF